MLGFMFSIYQVMRFHTDAGSNSNVLLFDPISTGAHMIGMSKTSNCPGFGCTVVMELEDLQFDKPNPDNANLLGDRSAIMKNMC